MVNENIPPVEIVAELESELNLEQKAQNQEYILSNLDKYIVDVHGNFFHIDEEMMVNGDKRFYVGQDAVEDHNKIKERIVEMIVNEKDSWEINDERNYVRRGCNKRTMSSSGFSSEQNEEIKKALGGENNVRNTTSITLTSIDTPTFETTPMRHNETFPTIIVPTSSIVGSVLSSHTQWMSISRDTMFTDDDLNPLSGETERVIIHEYESPARYPSPEILDVD